MPRILVLIFFTGLVSCGNHTQLGPVKDSVNNAQPPTSYGRYNRDSDFTDNPERYKQFNSADYTVFASRTIGHYLVTVLHYKQGPETNPDGSIPPARAVDALCMVLLRSLETGKYLRDTIQTLRISRPGERQGIPYTILPGTVLTVDTFFYRTQIITLHLGDSIFIRATYDQLELKLQGNDAG